MVYRRVPRTGSDKHWADADPVVEGAGDAQFITGVFPQPFLQSTIDALPAQVAILDAEGVIVAVNRAWTDETASRDSWLVYGSVGECYLTCRSDGMLAGIQAVSGGARESFFAEYQGDDPVIRRWFSLLAVPLSGSSPRHTMVRHEDITRRVRAELAQDESDRALEALVEASPLAIIALDRERRVTSWNPAAEKLFGWTRDEVLQRPNPIVPEDLRDEFVAHQQGLVYGTSGAGHEIRRRRKDGTLVDLSMAHAMLRTSGGEISGSMAVFTDISEQKRAQGEQRFLVEASELLSASIDYETTLAQVAQMAVPRLADCCMVHLLEGDSSIRRLAVAHADPEQQALAQQLKDHGRLEMNGAWGVPVVLRTGQPVLYSDMDSRLWDTGNEQIEHIDILRNLGMSSLMIVPLIAREQTIGTLAFVASDSGRIYTDTDLEIAMELARRAATAIDNARLHREVRQTELRLRTLVEHMLAVSYTAQADDLRAMMYVSSRLSPGDDFTEYDFTTDPDLWLQQLHPDDRERVESVMLACSASGEPLNIEYRIVSSDGQVNWRYDQATLIHDDSGHPLHWQGVYIDITERKHAEEALRVRARQQAAVAQLGQQAMGDIDLLDFLTDATHVVQETLEVEFVSCIRYEARTHTVSVEAGAGWREMYIRQGPGTLFPNSMTSYTLRSGKPVLMRDIATETRFTGSQTMLDHGIVSGLSVIVPGTPSPYGVLQVGSTRPRPFTEDDINFLQAIGNLLAATLEHHQDEDDIRFHAHLLDVVNQSVIATDLQGRITYWNHFAESMFGWSRAEALGRNVIDVTPSAATRDHSDEIMARLTIGESWQGTIELTRRDGSRFPALVTNSPVQNERGELVGVVSVSADITEWRQAESERENLLHDLGERVKELTVLHRTASLLQDDDCTIAEILSQLAAMLPAAMQYPEVAVALVSLGSLESTSPDYRQADWSISATFSAENNAVGRIEVAYLDQRWGDREPFLPEESSLLNTIGDMLNGYLQRVATQAELHRSETRFRAASEGGLDAFFILETVRTADQEIIDYVVLDLNARGAKFALRPRAELLEQRLMNLWDERVMQPFYEMFEYVSSTGETVERALQIDSSTGLQWFECQAVPLVDGVAVSIRDISDRKLLEEQLTHQAFHDALTGLPNRALFLDRVQHALGRVRPRHEGVAVLFMDLDNFKFVNDSLGHTVGDQLLRAVADRITHCLNESDTAARLGGDEFAILLEDLTDWALATETAEIIVSAFRDPFAIASREIFISPSIGIAIGANMDITAEDLLRDADAAMYRAKRNGRARYEVFEPSFKAHALQRFELENDLRRAIERGEFCLHYQPVVHLESGATIGVEALVRWNHPQHGLMSPLDFIPIAEDTGLIVPLGRWVLEEACLQVSAWNRQRADHAPLELGVNISRRQFYDPELSKHLEAALNSSRLDPRLLNLEITESVMIEDEDMATETLMSLKALGVQLAIDDFGTGYSSLGMLGSFPVDVLKIDRGFVSRIEAQSDDLVIISGIISLAHALNLLVVAEGVETQEQLEHLVALGCDFAQGYFLGKPRAAQPTGPPDRGLHA